MATTPEMTSKGGKRPTFGSLFPQLFLFPLLIVVVCVLVYVFFVASSKDNRTIEELVTDIESGGAHARNQDAYALGLLVRDLEPGSFLTPELTTRLVRLRERYADDRDFAKFVTVAIGFGGQPEQSVPLMEKLVRTPDLDPEERLSAVTALGLANPSRGIAPEYVATAAAALRHVVKTYSGSEDWEVRWHALAGLTNMRHEAGRADLKSALGDARRELRWSSACWLAKYFADPAGEDILTELLDWEFLGKELGERGRELHFREKELYMIQALEGLAVVQGDGLRPTLEKLRQESPSVKVRDAACRILDASRATDGSGGASADASPQSPKSSSAYWPNARTVRSELVVTRRSEAKSAQEDHARWTLRGLTAVTAGDEIAMDS